MSVQAGKVRRHGVSAKAMRHACEGKGKLTWGQHNERKTKGGQGSVQHEGISQAIASTPPTMGMPERQGAASQFVVQQAAGVVELPPEAAELLLN
jgi:hypothetical protein